MVHHTTLRRKPNKTNKTKKGGKKGKRFSKTKPYSKKAKSVRVRQRRRRTVARRKMRGGGGGYNPDGYNTPEDIYEEFTRLDKEIKDKITTCNNEKEQSTKDLSEEIRRQEEVINDKFKTCNDDKVEKEQLRGDFYKNNKDVIDKINYKKMSDNRDEWDRARAEKDRNEENARAEKEKM
jgi:hypothetical protein